MKIRTQYKKYIILITLAAALLICVLAYFKPISLSELVSENDQIVMVLSELGVREGEAYVDSTDHRSVTQKQRDAVMALLEQSACKRTFGTLLSDGSVFALGNKTLSIYMYDGDSLVGDIFVTASGKITVNEKLYRMKNAEQFIEQIIEILNLSS